MTVPSRAPAAAGTAAMCEVTLCGATTADAYRLARREAARFDNDPGHYGSNTLTRHLVGKLGEFAIADWFRSLGYTIDTAFADPARTAAADLIASRAGAGLTLRVEVKSWQNLVFDRYAGSVAASQYAVVTARSDLVVWVRCADLNTPTLLLLAERDPAQVGTQRLTVEGWSPTIDLLSLGRPVWEAGMRPNLRLDAEHWRPPAALENLHALPVPPEGAGPGPCRRHHRHPCWGCADGPPRARYPGAPAHRPPLPLPEQVLVAPDHDRHFHDRMNHNAGHLAHIPLSARTEVEVGDAAVRFQPCERCWPRA